MIGLNIGDAGVKLDMAGQFKEGSAWAGYFSTQGNAGELLGHVPSLCEGRSLLSLVDAQNRDVVLRAARAVAVGGTSGEVRARFRHARGHLHRPAGAELDPRKDPGLR